MTKQQPDNSMRICTNCQRTLPASQFSRAYHYLCKDCYAEYMRRKRAQAKADKPAHSQSRYLQVKILRYPIVLHDDDEPIAFDAVINLDRIVAALRPQNREHESQVLLEGGRAFIIDYPYNDLIKLLLNNNNNEK